MIKHEGMHPLLEKLGKDALVPKNHGITHLDDASLYIFSEKDILLMIQGADPFVKNDRETAPLYAN